MTRAKELYAGTPVDFTVGSWDDHDKIRQANVEMMERIDREAKEAGSLAGRFIHYPVADGAAHYQVVSVGKRTCRIRLCLLGDDNWHVAAWGAEASIPIATASNLVGRQDALSALFGSER